MLNIATIAMNGMIEILINFISIGNIEPNAHLLIIDGVKPASPQLPITGTLLAVLNFSVPTFHPPNNGVAHANTITLKNAIISSGTASWFRITNCNDVPIVDGDISPVGGGGDLQLDNINFVAGGAVEINSLQLIMPH